MKVGELIDLRKKGMVWKSTVAAGKQPRTNLGVLGISIGQEQSSGTTSRVNEASLQGLLKNALKRAGSLRSVLGDDAEEGAELLGAKVTDPAFVIRANAKLSPAEKAAVKSVVGSSTRKGDDELRLVKLSGARKLLVLNGDIITTDLHRSDLVEAQLGARVKYDSYRGWKHDLPKKSTFSHDVTRTGSKERSIERAQAFGMDFEGVAGEYDHDKNTGWIYEYYLNKKNLREANLPMKFMLGSKEHRDALERGGIVKKKSVTVGEVLRKVKASTMSSADELDIIEALAGHKKTDSLSLTDIDQLAVIANVDVVELRDILGLEI